VIEAPSQLKLIEMQDNHSGMNVRDGRFGASVILVTLYLLLVGLWLVLTRRISPPSFSKVLLSYCRKRCRGRLQSYLREQGNCFISPVPSKLISDEEGISELVLFEDGVPLPYAHASHEDIRSKGAGRYSHWGAQVYFSASDNSDPLTNNRVYEFVEC